MSDSIILDVFEVIRKTLLANSDVVAYLKDHMHVSHITTVDNPVYPALSMTLLPASPDFAVPTMECWFMHYVHISATEAIDAFRDLGAKYFIPAQWGTFHLGDNPPGYPVLDLKKAMREQNVDPSRFMIMDIGQIIQRE